MLIRAKMKLIAAEFIPSLYVPKHCDYHAGLLITLLIHGATSEQIYNQHDDTKLRNTMVRFH